MQHLQGANPFGALLVSICAVGEDMTFSVRIASNDKPRLAARADAGEAETTKHFSEFCQGISFGIGLLLAFVVAYLVISAVAGSFPSLQWLQAHWLTVR